MNIRILALLLSPILFFGCKKEHKTSNPVSPLVKKYFSYQPGSYWIYRDSLTGQVDSFVVMSNESSTITSTYGQRADGVYMRIYSYNGNQDDSISLDIGLAGNTVTLIYGDPHTSISVDFSYPYTNVGTLTDLGYATNLITLSEHAIINNQTYDSVAHIIVQYNSPATKPSIIFDLNTTVGIIKMVIDNAGHKRIFELVRYNLIR